jgi:hypothetical protein
MTFNTGRMPHGESYEDFAELLARFYVTFLPLKSRGDGDTEDFGGISEHLARMARRYNVPVPAAVMKDSAISPFSTPSEAFDHLNAFSRDHGLCQPGVPHAAQDIADKNALGQALIAIFHRYRALIARFVVEGERKVAVGIETWIGSSEFVSMDTVLDPMRKAA